MMERIKSMDLPTEAFIIMINIVGFASDGVTLDNQQFVEETQSHYMNLLYRSALFKTYFISKLESKEPFLSTLLIPMPVYQWLHWSQLVR